MDTNGMETPLSQSSVSLKLEEIQERCKELLDEPDALLGLTLEEPVADPRSNNDPYNRHRVQTSSILRRFAMLGAY
jgi:hypothetical protein